MSMGKKLVAELIGTTWLVFGGGGSAVFAAAFTSGVPGNIHLGIGFTGVAFAFGLTLLTMVYTIGPISGCHINPAVSLGLWAGNWFPASQLLPYIIAQVLGGVLGAFFSTLLPPASQVLMWWPVVLPPTALASILLESILFWRRWCLRWS